MSDNKKYVLYGLACAGALVVAALVFNSVGSK